MVGEEREGLYVERESWLCPPYPQVGVLGLRHSVVGGVDLDERELRRVEVQTFFRRLGGHGIEELGIDQRLVDPAGDAGADGHRVRSCHNVRAPLPTAAASRPGPTSPLGGEAGGMIRPARGALYPLLVHIQPS